MLKETDN